MRWHFRRQILFHSIKKNYKIGERTFLTAEKKGHYERRFPQQIKVFSPSEMINITF